MAAFTCKKCRKKNGKTAKFCKHCGSQDLIAQAPAPSGDAIKGREPKHREACHQAELECDSPGKGEDANEETERDTRDIELTPMFPNDGRKTGPFAGAPAHGPRFVVEVVTGADAGRSAEVREGQTVTIGAAPPSDFIVPSDPHVSGRHATMTLQDGVLRLADEDSTNGTYLQVQYPVDITDGAVVILGGATRLRVTRIE